jgi:hypothetical protein
LLFIQKNKKAENFSTQSNRKHVSEVIATRVELENSKEERERERAETRKTLIAV